MVTNCRQGNWSRICLVGHKEKIFPITDSGAALEQVARRDCDIFILGETQNSPRQGLEQLGLSLTLKLGEYILENVYYCLPVQLS